MSDWPTSKKKTRVPKVNCLKCGSENTANVDSKLDSRKRRVRTSRCYDCNTFYNTVYDDGQLVNTYEIGLNIKIRRKI